MNKNIYIAPSMEQITIELGSMLAASERVNVYTNTKVDASESLSNDRRRWGDLWVDGNE